jgi:hypothetical protein
MNFGQQINTKDIQSKDEFFQKSFERLIIRLWLLLINDKTIASKQY